MSIYSVSEKLHLKSVDINRWLIKCYTRKAVSEWGANYQISITNDARTLTSH